MFAINPNPDSGICSTLIFDFTLSASPLAPVPIPSEQQYRTVDLFFLFGGSGRRLRCDMTAVANVRSDGLSVTKAHRDAPNA